MACQAGTGRAGAQVELAVDCAVAVTVTETAAVRICPAGAAGGRTTRVGEGIRERHRLVVVQLVGALVLELAGHVAVDGRWRDVGRFGTPRRRTSAPHGARGGQRLAHTIVCLPPQGGRARA